MEGVVAYFQVGKACSERRELVGQTSQARKGAGKGKGGQYSGGSRWNQQAQPELRGATAKDIANVVVRRLK